jgi:type I restriction enzyme S subunit
VLLCKINPRINRSWVVGSFSPHPKIASTEWIIFPPNEAIESKYLNYFLKQNQIRDFLAANTSGVGGSLMRVRPATIKDYAFPVAPLNEQKRIVAEIEKQFSRLDEAVNGLKRVKANLKRTKPPSSRLLKVTGAV